MAVHDQIQQTWTLKLKAGQTAYAKEEEEATTTPGNNGNTNMKKAGTKPTPPQKRENIEGNPYGQNPSRRRHIQRYHNTRAGKRTHSAPGGAIPPHHLRALPSNKPQSLPADDEGYCGYLFWLDLRINSEAGQRCSSHPTKDKLQEPVIAQSHHWIIQQGRMANKKTNTNHTEENPDDHQTMKDNPTVNQWPVYVQ